MKAPPRRLASWWSVLDDLQWPQQQTRDKIRRRADAFASAGVDTAIQFGFHCRFDFAPYFGLLHGLFADIAECLHERGILFLDHYSCNVVARPRTPEDLALYHKQNRHHVAVHPDPLSATTASYEGIRFNDLREIDVGTGEAAYIPHYQAELFCVNNPAFRRMHAAYLRRQISEIPLDGFEIDDMADYAYFRACGCTHCRARFLTEFGRELPPLTDGGFWGDTSRHPTEWGNYDNPAFRDWVEMRYRRYADHLSMVREAIGPDRILMTCCSNSGPLVLNSLGLSYERHKESCDWLMLENCGLTPRAARWREVASGAILHKALGTRMNPVCPAPAIALSYSIYEDGAYLGWAIARFLGVPNWFSSLANGLPVTPDDAMCEAELIGPLNRWEAVAGDLDPNAGRDVPEVRIAFNRAARDAGLKDAAGRDHWQHVEAWCLALLDRDVAFRIVTEEELADAAALCDEKTPLVLDGCALLSHSQQEAIAAYVAAGGTAWVAAPCDGIDHARVGKIPDKPRDEVLARLLAAGHLHPRIRRISGPDGWRARLRVHGGELVLHLLNERLTGIEHPTLTDRWLVEKVMVRIDAETSREPLVLEIDCQGLPGWESPVLESPELDDPRPVGCTVRTPGTRLVEIPLQRLRIYAQVRNPNH